MAPVVVGSGSWSRSRSRREWVGCSAELALNIWILVDNIPTIILDDQEVSYVPFLLNSRDDKTGCLHYENGLI